jgi:hypothetical protein
LFHELSSILKSGQEHYQQYQESVQETQAELSSVIENWRFFHYTSSAPSAVPVNDISEQLYQVAHSVFSPYEVFFTAGGSDCRVDSRTIREHLQATHHQETIYPILQGIYLDFVSYFSVEKVFREFNLGTLLTLNHQALARGHAYAETYEWQSLCAHTRTWAYLLHGYDVDISSMEFQRAYEAYVNVVLQADAEIYRPPAPVLVPTSGAQEEMELEMDEHVMEEEKEEEALCGSEVIASIEDLTSRVMRHKMHEE